MTKKVPSTVWLFVLPVLLIAAAVTAPSAIGAGGDTCATATPILSLPFNSSGDTTTRNNEMIFLSPSCAGGGKFSRAGRDEIYSITVYPGNSLTFQVNPDLTYDPAIYILSVCGNGSTCSHAVDAGGEGASETIGPVVLSPGTHFFYVDSQLSEDEKGGFGPYTMSVTGFLGTPNNANFYTVVPCRVLDTREADGPALTAEMPRTFQVAGRCEIPAEAKSISANVTVADPSAAGFVTVYPGGAPLPGASTINYGAGQTRANNALVPLGVGGTISAVSGQPPGNTVHFILDVNGYFQ